MSDFPNLSRQMWRKIGFGIVEPGNWREFPSEDWYPDSHLATWGSIVFIPLVRARAPHSGAFKRLIAGLEAKGLAVGVVAPGGGMKAILAHWGWSQMGVPGVALEVWGRP